LVEPLSQRELEVLQLVAEALTNREIASRLFLSLNTVKAHTRNIYGKLGAHSRTQAVARARGLGGFALHLIPVILVLAASKDNEPDGLADNSPFFVTPWHIS
jgi:DNA-binding CsgD family transcriptional regulator